MLIVYWYVEILIGGYNLNYVVFDLEFNQGYKYKRKNRSRVNPKCRFEIIQIDLKIQ